MLVSAAKVARISAVRSSRNPNSPPVCEKSSEFGGRNRRSRDDDVTVDRPDRLENTGSFDN